jgi:hypothetical protein
MLGREVKTLVNDRLASGYYNYTWNAGSIASGTYFYRITAVTSSGEKVYSAVKKLLLIK